MLSKEQRPSTWPSSTSATSYGIAPVSPASRATSSFGTNRNSAAGSTKRLINHGQAMRSTLAFSRVIHFIGLISGLLPYDNDRKRARQHRSATGSPSARRTRSGRRRRAVLGRDQQYPVRLHIQRHRFRTRHRLDVLFHFEC